MLRLCVPTDTTQSGEYVVFVLRYNNFLVGPLRIQVRNQPGVDAPSLHLGTLNTLVH